MNPPDDLDPLARRLLAWTPAPVRSGRDRVLFEVGVAAGRRQARWQAAALLVPILVGSLGWIGHERTERHRLELALSERVAAPRTLTRQEVAPAPSLEPVVTPGPSSYLVLSHRTDSAGSDGFDPIELRPGPLAPALRADVRSVLTPLSSRRPQDFAEL